MSAAAEHLRRVLALGPAEDDHWAALRVGIGVAVPSLLLISTGRPDLLLYAVFGAFTGMYGRNETHRLRLRHQAQAALMLVSAVGIGVVLSASHTPEWVLVVLLQFPTELFMTRNYGLALVFFTPLILLMTQLANPLDPATLLTDRAIETIGGALVGMAVALAIRPRRVREPTAWGETM